MHSVHDLASAVSTLAHLASRIALDLEVAEEQTPANWGQLHSLVSALASLGSTLTEKLADSDI